MSGLTCISYNAATLTLHIIGVFDGHGGSNVSKYVKKTLYSSFLRQLTEAGPWSDKAISQALIDCLCKVNTDILHINRWSHQGSTAAIVYVNYQQKKGCKDTDNDTSEYSIITANIGDSRIVLARGKKAIPLTVDHKPDNILEKVRIEKVGGHVVWHGLIRNGRPIVGSGVHRVNGNLSLSRALGDKAERPFISSIPDILITDSDAHDRFIILATDGLWDVFTSDEIVAFVYEILATVGTKKASIKSTMATMLTEEALRRGSSDNITALVIWLR